MGVRIHYRWLDGTGDRPTVVLLHGLGSCGDDWVLQLPALTADYRVLTMDLPCHARSGCPQGWPTINRLAETVDGLMEGLAIGSAHIVGLSLGGTVGLTMAVRSPKRVRSLTAVNTFARLGIDPGGRWRVGLRAIDLLFGRMDQMGQLVAEGLFPEEGQEELRRVAAARLAANPRGAYLKMMVALLRFNLLRHLPEIAVPTLIVAGGADTTVAMAAKEQLRDRIPGARWVRFPDSGHATPMDTPDGFNEALLKFLGDVDAGAPSTL